MARIMENISETVDVFIESINPDELVRSVVIFAGSFVLLRLVKSLIVKRILKIAQKTKFDLDDLVAEILNSFGFLFYFTLSLYIATELSSVSDPLTRFVSKAAFIVFIYYGIKAISSIVNYGFTKALAMQRRTESEFDPSVLKVVRRIVNVVIWIIAILFILQNIGYDVTTLIGGLGVAGIAVAFGVQSLLEDVISYFSIYFDKPFTIGDFIVIGDDMGEVQKIGLKSTRIKTLRGEELVVSNKELTGARINNFRRMDRRRIEFQIGVTYETPSKKLKKIPEIVQEVVESQNLAELDRAHFEGFGDFALTYEIVYFVDTADYNKFMDVQEAINLELVERFEKEKIEFAYPTQTLYVKK